MSAFAELVNVLKSRRKVLLLTGYLCDEMELDGRRLVDYAADIALKLDLPVAATGNTVVALKERGVRANKKVLAEMVNLTRFPRWGDPAITERPEVMVFIGYPPGILRPLLPALKNVETVVLGNVCLKEAGFSLPDASLSSYQQNLELLISELGG